MAITRTTPPAHSLWLALAVLVGLVVVNVVHARDKAVSHSAEFHGQNQIVMQKMDRDMRMAAMNGDPDHDFLAMMIPHHQGAVDMAAIYLNFGKDEKLRQMARHIIESQTAEIGTMREQLAAKGSDGATTATMREMKHTAHP